MPGNPAQAVLVTRPIYQVKAQFFKTLGHPARIRVLEVLRDGECSVGELIPAVGIEPSHLSQQLGILRRANILPVRKQGATPPYSGADPRIFYLPPVAPPLLTPLPPRSDKPLAPLPAP